jgi:hypothetical protein
VTTTATACTSWITYTPQLAVAAYVTIKSWTYTGTASELPNWYWCAACMAATYATTTAGCAAVLNSS